MTLPSALSVAALALLLQAPAQQPAPSQVPEPKQGQAGKDVIWMPTPETLVERMLTMAQVGPRDVVYDLGSGDGRLVIAAAKRGAQAVGVEFNPDLVAFAEERARQQGVGHGARFVQGDIFETDFSSATVVTLYLLSQLNLRLRPQLLKLKPGTRVVSHAFTMDDWPADEVSRSEQRTAYLWIVPADVQGTWRFELTGAGRRRRDSHTALPEARGHGGARNRRGRAARARAAGGRDPLRLRGREGRLLRAVGHGRRPAHHGQLQERAGEGQLQRQPALTTGRRRQRARLGVGG